MIQDYIRITSKHWYFGWFKIISSGSLDDWYSQSLILWIVQLQSLVLWMTSTFQRYQLGTFIVNKGGSLHDWYFPTLLVRKDYSYQRWQFGCLIVRNSSLNDTSVRITRKHLYFRWFIIIIITDSLDDWYQQTQVVLMIWSNKHWQFGRFGVINTCSLDD